MKPAPDRPAYTVCVVCDAPIERVPGKGGQPSKVCSRACRRKWTARLKGRLIRGFQAVPAPWSERLAPPICLECCRPVIGGDGPTLACSHRCWLRHEARLAQE